MVYIARSGFAYSPKEVRINLLVLFGERAKRSGLKGYSMIWGDGDRVYVNMKPPYDRVALLNLAAPELRPVLQIRAVRFAAAEIPAAQERIGAALKPVGAGWGITYDYRSDRFEVMIPESFVPTALSLVPLDLSDYTDVSVGGEIVLLGQSRTSQPIKDPR